MIAFEDLCQALERFNRRRRNQEEMAELDQPVPAAAPSAPVEPTDVAMDMSAFDDVSADPISLDDLGADVVPMDGEPTQLSARPAAPEGGERQD